MSPCTAGKNASPQVQGISSDGRPRAQETVMSTTALLFTARGGKESRVHYWSIMQP